MTVERTFHVFVRKLSAGVAISLLEQPHLASFAADLETARADLANVVRKLLERGELADGELPAEAKLRRVDLAIRAVQRGRLLEVPMRFSAVIWPRPSKHKRRRPPHEVLVPRLGLRAELVDAADLMPFVEELIRHRLHMAPLERLHELAWTGEESLEQLVVSAKPREPRVDKPADARAERAPLPSGLDECCVRLADELAAGSLDRAFERTRELGLVEDVLGARQRASLLLVGPAGAGKTALVHELAHRAGEPIGKLASLEIYSTSGGRIMAGMRYFGEWQGRVQRMISSLRGRRAVLHLESLAELLSVAGTREITDLLRFLTPAVVSGEITVIVEAAAADVARAERSQAAFVQALRPIAVQPLDALSARLALDQVAGHVARRRRVKFIDGALDRALDLAERFGGSGLPGAAVDLLRAAAQPQAVVRGNEVRQLGADEITRAFSARTGYPLALIDPAVRLDPAEVLAKLRERVDGQDEATLLLSHLVVTLKTNLADPRRPLGSFLLLGPTGVGKTESALALATYLFGDVKRLARFDMAEYAAPGSAVRLLASSGGSPSLARRVREQPFGVVLLDEVEKADGSVHDLLLQVLGEGRVSDDSGQTVSFRNTIVLLTSNLGADSVGRSIGFGSGGAAAHDAHYRAAAARFFRPELLNRFDQIVPYRPLSADVVARLAGRALDEALAREGLLMRNVSVSYTPDVVARLAELGFDARLGARPLKRAVETHVVAPLARLLARSAVHPATRLQLVVEGGVIEPRGAP